ncbi:MAG: hypothetical protein HY763_06280 [Planctomycetes bacterium]|nr:hypothetical protein [Planctomycetota bacterium]
MRRTTLRPARRVCDRAVCVALCAVLASVPSPGCNLSLDLPGAENPFRDLPPVPRDGRLHSLRANLAPLGTLMEGQTLRLLVRGASVTNVLILLGDEREDAAGVVVGGGPVGTEFEFRAAEAGSYFVFVHSDPSGGGDVQLLVGPPGQAPASPRRQAVLVSFAPDYLTHPGLWDPIDAGEENRALLASLSDLVREEILIELRALFAETPIDILSEEEALPAGPVSRVTFLPDRVPAEDQDAVDAALPVPDPSRPQCQVRVIFGEVLPRGAAVDVGNRVPDDEAVVYVGSFQGRGKECWTSAINSVSSVVLTLSQTAAHEIGHLVGLFHVEQIDVMNRTATLAFLRELPFGRGQVQLERRRGSERVGEVFTSVIQDPAVYFRAVFQTPR